MAVLSVVGFSISWTSSYDSSFVDVVYAESVESYKTNEQIASDIFGDKADIMLAIAFCESSHRQFSTSTIPLVSSTNDVGFMQINRRWWGESAQRLGLDYENDLKDNMRMAKIILDIQGLKAWTTYNNGCYLKYL